jgi:tetratricopeptide (TPR) repeat protein
LRVHIRNLIPIAVIAAIAALPCVSHAQSREPLLLPNLHGDRNVAAQAAMVPSTDPAINYSSRHEAAVAALKAAAQIASLGRGNDRVINFLLIAAKRDPAFGKVVYDLGLMCAKGERWDDAIRFYERAQQIDKSKEVAQLAADELERVQLLNSLESTPEGRRRREFDREFLEKSKMAAENAAAAADSLRQLATYDATRWEAPALQGVLQATLGNYGASALALRSASQLAPEERRQDLLAAAELATREATYVDSEHQAQIAWEKQQYETAAKLYSLAWETSPGRTAVGMQAAVAFLMGDWIGPAVQILTRIGQMNSSDDAARAGAMLKELEPVSADAARASTLRQNAATDAPAADPAERIRKLVGDLTSPQMLLICKAPPPFLQDNAPFIKFFDSELDLNGPTAAFLSTESIFARYERAVAGVAPAPPDAATPTAPPSAGMAQPPAANPPAANPPAEAAPVQVPDRPPALPPRRESPVPKLAQGPSYPLTITSRPAGATVVVDVDGIPSNTCTTPCDLVLARVRHGLGATLNGYREIHKVIDKGSSAPSVELVFERKQGTIKVTGVPVSWIDLDGNRIYLPESRILIVPEGNHEIGTEINGEVRKQTLHVNDGEWVKIVF